MEVLQSLHPLTRLGCLHVSMQYSIYSENMQEKSVGPKVVSLKGQLWERVSKLGENPILLRTIKL